LSKTSRFAALDYNKLLHFRVHEPELSI
jgi:hypothetical protein